LIYNKTRISYGMTSSDFGYKFLDRALNERIPIDPGVITNPFIH